MSEQTDIFHAAAELSRAGALFVLITVIRTKGSTPRDAGAKMIWRPSPNQNGHATPASTLIGTVGGGQFEHLVIDAAQKHLRDRSCGIEHYTLGSDADQCCGGTMEVFFEHHGAAQLLVLFGAGHVAKELAEMLEGSPISVAIVDDRPDWNSAERFPHAERIDTWERGVALCREKPSATLACVMTCSHDTDFDILRLMHKGDGDAGASVTPPAFVGLIGSRSKRVCLFGRLVASGIDEERVEKIHCPIGVGDTGKAPRLVAISMAAQLLLEAKRLASL